MSNYPKNSDEMWRECIYFCKRNKEMWHNHNIDMPPIGLSMRDDVFQACIFAPSFDFLENMAGMDILKMGFRSDTLLYVRDAYVRSQGEGGIIEVKKDEHDDKLKTLLANGNKSISEAVVCFICDDKLNVNILYVPYKTIDEKIQWEDGVFLIEGTSGISGSVTKTLKWVMEREHEISESCKKDLEKYPPEERDEIYQAYTVSFLESKNYKVTNMSNVSIEEEVKEPKIRDKWRKTDGSRN